MGAKGSKEKNIENHDNEYEVSHRTSQGRQSVDEEIETQHNGKTGSDFEATENTGDNDFYNSTMQVDETTNFYHDIQYNNSFQDGYPDWVIIEIEVGQLILQTVVVKDFEVESSVVKEEEQVGVNPPLVHVPCVLPPEHSKPPHTPLTRVSFSDASDRGKSKQALIDDNENTKNADGVDTDHPKRRGSGVSIESFRSDISTASNICDDSTPTRIQTYLKYNLTECLLTVGVKQAECPLNSKYKDRKVYWQVQLALLPHCLSERRKTKYESTQSPTFNQSFDFHNISKDALHQMAVRFRLYGSCGRVGRKKAVSEVEVGLEDLLHKTNNVIDGEGWILTNKVSPNHRVSNNSST